MHESTLRQSVIVVQSVDSFSLCKAIVNIFLHIKTVHVNELWRIIFFKQLLLETVAVLAVVNDNFTMRAAQEPLVIWC